MTEARVDVVILSWNRPEATCRAIDSAVRQRGVDVRVQVVDQGSDSDALNFVERHIDDLPQVELTKLEHNLGVPGGRNIGIARGTAPFVVGLDNDAILVDSDALTKVVSRFDREPEAAALAFRVLCPQGGDDPLMWVHGAARLPSADQSFLTTKFVGCGFALRRSALEAVGAFDADLFFCREELELSYRLIEAGYSIRYTPDVLVLHFSDGRERLDWEDGRWFRFVKNGVYLALEYESVPDIVKLLAGWTAKGAVNRLTKESLRAGAAGVSMFFESGRRTPLSTAARSYLRQFDLRKRGRFVSRLKDEVLSPLPGRKG